MMQFRAEEFQSTFYVWFATTHPLIGSLDIREMLTTQLQILRSIRISHRNQDPLSSRVEGCCGGPFSNSAGSGQKVAGCPSTNVRYGPFLLNPTKQQC